MTTRSVTIPLSVQTVDAEAFYLCESIKSLTFLNPQCELQGDHSVPFAENDGFSFNGIIHGFADSTAQAFAEAHNYTFAVIGEKKFDPLVDGNSFTHNDVNNNDGFYECTNYQFHDNDYKENLKIIHALDEKEINKYCDRKWGGSCYGIAKTIILQCTNKIDVTELSHSQAENFYQMERPCENDEFLDTINYYFMTQYSRTQDASLTFYCKIWPVSIATKVSSYTINLHDTLKTIVNYTSNADHPYLLNLNYYKQSGLIPDATGHSLVTTECCFDDSENCYIVKLFDCNRPGKFIPMLISSDFNKFGFTDSHGINVGNWASGYNYTSIELVNPIKYSASGLPNNANPLVRAANENNHSSYYTDPDEDHTLTLELSAQAAFLLTDADGKYLRYDGDNTEGTMECSSLKLIPNAERSIFQLTVPYSDSFTLENLGKQISFAISGADTLLSLDEASISGAVFDLTENSIQINKSTGSYIAYLPPAKEDGTLVRITGTAKGNVTFSAENGTVNVAADNPMTNVTVKSLTLNENRIYSAVSSDELTITAGEDGALSSEQICDIGDVNGDGVLSAEDAEMLLNYLLGDPNASFRNFRAADCDDNGRINAADLTLLKRLLFK